MAITIRRWPTWAADLKSAAQVLATIAVAIAGGLAGDATGLPAGTLLGAMLAVAALNLITDGGAKLPRVLRHGSRILTGAVIGSLVTGALLASLVGYLPWVALFTAIIILVSLACAWLLSRLTRLGKSTTLLACAPGGLPEMSALADDLGSRVDIVVGLHVLRKVVALVVISLVVMLVSA